LVTQQEILEATKIVQNARVVLTQLEIPLARTIDALKIAKEGKVTTILNTAPAKEALPEDIYGLVDILCANETELRILSGQLVNNQEDAIRAAKSLLGKGAKQVIVTLGAQGSLFVDKEKSTHVPAQKLSEPVRDTSGAGDCFLGSFAYFLSSGFDIETSMKKASYIAGISVTRLGTQSSYPSKDELPLDLFK